MRIALAHDWLVGMRGGERILDRIACLAEDRSDSTPSLHVLVTNGDPHADAIDACPISTSPLQRLPGGSGRLRRWYLPLYPWAVRRLRVDDCDLLISSHSSAIKAITPPAGAKHLCYCHSPARYIWSRSSHYGRGLKRIGLRMLKGRYQSWDRRMAANVDRFVANSQFTSDQIKTCYGRDSEVLHPPVRTTFFTPEPNEPRSDSLVVVSALEPYKRIDIAIQAANSLRIPLIVAGDGSERRRLEDLAGPTVTMLGPVTDERVRSLYRQGRAFVFPAVEDFGIAPVEAMACGTPIIALEAGGAVDTVNERTGVFFSEQTTASLIDAIRRFESCSFDSATIRTCAERFSEAEFDRKFAALIDSMS